MKHSCEEPIPTSTIELAELLHDFREFVQDNAVVWQLGADHHNPIWARVAMRLGKYGRNEIPGSRKKNGWAKKYFNPDPEYHPASRKKES
jgi:hypothetical protein